MTQLEVEQQGPHIQVSELFGPTIQGEGVEVGRPCLFIRLQHCPVHCPGCDSFFTWNGTEKGARTPIETIREWVMGRLADYPGCGVVLSGGEPLLHFRNEAFRRMLSSLPTWVSLETSGYAGRITDDRISKAHFHDFLDRFTTVHLSPKVTPCLHGIQSDEELLANVPLFLRWRSEDLANSDKLAFKFVVRDEKDTRVVEEIDHQFGITEQGIPTYVMPYGTEAAEVMETCRDLVDSGFLAKTGYILSPRLHSILWGPKRGV